MPVPDHIRGGMIALMPTEADAKRLALDGGEPAEELHCTLMFLGKDGSVFDQAQRQALVGAVQLGASALSSMECNIFGVAHWNGGGDKPSWVWNVGDVLGSKEYGLEWAHHTVCASMGMAGLMDIPDQHTPWVAHICAAYTKDLTPVRELEKRLGPVTFDRIRVSFGDEDHDIPLGGALTASVGPLHRNPTQAEIDSGWDFAGHQRGWKNAVDATMHDWSGVTARWRNQIKAQLAGLGDDADKLSALKVDTDLGAEILYTHIRRTAEAAARAQQREAEGQGVKVPDWDLDNVTAALTGTGQLRAVASVTSNILGSSLVQSAKRHALRLFGVRSDEALATDVDDEMADLSDAFPRENIGSSMTAAQNLGRLAVLSVILEPGVYLASEALDKNTCRNCIAIDGTEFSTLRDAREAYPQGGYAQCQGGGRCRGTMIAVWGRGETASAVPADSDDRLAALYAAEGQAAVATAEEVITEETEELGGKPNPGTKKDKRVKGNYEDDVETLAAQDCPPGMEMDSKTGKCMKVQEQAALAPVVEPAADSKTAPWRGPLTVEGIETGDGREFDTGALTWPEDIQPGEVPLRWNRVDSHGGAPQTEAVNVGSITRIWREGSLVMGEGMLDLGDDDGQRVHDKIKGGFLRGVSVDVDSIKDTDMELVWPEAPDGTGDGDLFDQMFAAPEKVIFHKGRIRAATIVDIPAFAEAYIALLDEEGAVIAGGEPIGALRANRSPRAVFTGVALRASANGWAPPLDWFANPDLSVPTGITIDTEGRVYGHAALWGTCHIGQEGVCVTPPREEDHPYFMTGEMICADDARVSVGQITVGTGHAPLSQNARAASDHYDNTGSAVADVVVGNDVHGIWVAGAIRPGADSGRVHELRAAGQVSGDWRRIGGQLRLVGLLAVNVPGFPVPKLKTRITAGSQFALVASGIPNLSEQLTEDELDQWAYRRVMGKLIDRVHRKG